MIALANPPRQERQPRTRRPRARLLLTVGPDVFAVHPIEVDIGRAYFLLSADEEIIHVHQACGPALCNCPSAKKRCGHVIAMGQVGLIDRD